MIWVGLLTILGALPFISASCRRPTGPIFGWGFINGLPVNGRFPEGTKVYFECELGSGSRIIHHPSICQSNGQWTQTSGCEVTCPSLSIPGLTYNTPLLYDQYHSRRGYSVSTKASFPCDERDPREGSSSAICQNSGNWVQQAPICKKTCDEPIIPANGSLHSTSRSRYPNGKYPKRSEVIFQYQTGNGTALRHRFCKDGKWTRLTPLNARCDDPIGTANQTARYINERKGPRVNGKYREGTEAYFFECELGNSSRILHRPNVCQANGEWSQTSGCEVVCPSLTVTDGKVDYNTSRMVYYDNYGYSVNTMASFSCFKHYQREGNSSAICQSSGDWSEQTPTCNSKPCLKPTVDNLRFSQPPIDGFFSQGTLLRFECDSGYTLLFPRPDFDSSVCQPNGTWFPPIPTCILEEV